MLGFFPSRETLKLIKKFICQKPRLFAFTRSDEQNVSPYETLPAYKSTESGMRFPPQRAGTAFDNFVLAKSVEC
jgi:hypothetical protein